jgi:thioredoxin-dependent peroxiredoxin
MRRNPVIVGAGLESFAIRTRGLSAETGCAGENGRSACGGNVPHAESNTDASNATKPRHRDTMNAGAPMGVVMLRLFACALVLLGLSLTAKAALDIGETAPSFVTQAALGGTVYSFSLVESLKKGPVVLYFFPAAYSEDCSIEAHYFADATEEFKQLGASVIGVSGDDIETLTKFSIQVCQSRFPVASDKTQAIMKSFDAVMQTRPEYANRISYVIAPNGTVVFQYMSLNPTKHVEKTLDALRVWSDSRNKK